MIPTSITTALTRLVRSRDKWKRLALDRRKNGTRLDATARDKAASELLFAVAIEGLASHQSRGARGCLWRALEALRPDITATMENGLDDAHDALERFFPDPEAGK